MSPNPGLLSPAIAPHVDAALHSPRVPPITLSPPEDDLQPLPPSLFPSEGQPELRDLPAPTPAASTELFIGAHNKGGLPPIASASAAFDPGFTCGYSSLDGALDDFGTGTFGNDSVGPFDLPSQDMALGSFSSYDTPSLLTDRFSESLSLSLSHDSFASLSEPDAYARGGFDFDFRFDPGEMVVLGGLPGHVGDDGVGVGGVYELRGAGIYVYGPGEGGELSPGVGVPMIDLDGGAFGAAQEAAIGKEGAAG